MIKVYTAIESYLIREGIKQIVSNNAAFSFCGEADNMSSLIQDINISSPDVLIIDYTHPNLNLDAIAKVLKKLPDTQVLAITNIQTRRTFINAINKGITGHLLYNCGKQEITDAIIAVSKKEKFFCGRILELLVVNQKVNENSVEAIIEQTSCDPLRLSEREIEIVKFIAEGNTTRQIAKILFISAHTVNTHRKNIMGKLNINNTAGLIMYALNEDIINHGKQE